MKSDAHETALGALDAFFAVIREKADVDATFAVAIIKALGVPIKITIEEGKNANDAIPYIDPVHIASLGLDEFRSIFNPMKDATLKKIIKDHNLIEGDALKVLKGAPLRDQLWEAAVERRKVLVRRAA